MNEHDDKNNAGTPSSDTVRIYLIVSTTIVALALMATILLLRGCGIFEKNTPSGLISQVLDRLREKRQIEAAVGAFFRESREKRLQFKQRDVELHFKIVRWRDAYGKKHEMAGPLPLVDAADIKATLGQRAIAEASGKFEITFYIELSNQRDWSYRWDKTTKTLTIIAPPFAEPRIGCNTPALKDALNVRTIEDCVTFDEDETKRLLKKRIPDLKKHLAIAQLKGVREDARRSLEEFFSDMLPKLVGAPDAENDVRVDVVFKDELKATEGKTPAY